MASLDFHLIVNCACIRTVLSLPKRAFFNDSVEGNTVILTAYPKYKGYLHSWKTAFFLKQYLNLPALHKGLLANKPQPITDHMVGYRSGILNSCMVNLKFHLIQRFCKIFARFLSFHV